jgi:succinate dehydrogenase hydrophobic anchor subunit
LNIPDWMEVHMDSATSFLVLTLAAAILLPLLGGAVAALIAYKAAMPRMVVWSAFGATAGALLTAVLLYASLVAQTHGVAG